MSNKSEAAWHPNSAPVTDHTDLIARHDARLIKRVGEQLDRDVYHASGFETDVRDLRLLAMRHAAALGDSVPRDQYDRLQGRLDWQGAVTSALLPYQERALDAERQCDEARAERDALAHVVEQVKGWFRSTPDSTSYETLRAILAAAPTVHLDRHDAEVKAQALDEVREAWSNDWSDVFDVDEQVGNAEAVGDWLRVRAASMEEGDK